MCCFLSANATSYSSDAPTLNQDIKLPLMMNGKRVGEVCIKAGTQVTVSERRGGSALVKRGDAVGWVSTGVFVGEEPKPPAILGSDKQTVDSLLKDWESIEGNYNTSDQESVRYTKDVQMTVTFIGKLATKVEIDDRVGAGISPIPETRFQELIRIIGKAPAASDVRVDSGIRGFFVMQDPPTDVDLLAGTFFGKKIFGKTVDEVTDILGRPSGIQRQTDAEGATTTDLYYLELGARLHFSAKPMRCSKISVFLAAADEPEGLYKQFKGTITKGLSADWKSKQVVQEFARYGAEDSYSQRVRSSRDEFERVRKQTKSELEKLEIERAKLTGSPVRLVEDTSESLARLLDETSSIFTTVNFKTQNNLFVTVNYEETTTFVESIDISVNLD